MEFFPILNFSIISSLIEDLNEDIALVRLKWIWMSGFFSERLIAIYKNAMLKKLFFTFKSSILRLGIVSI